MEKYKEFLTKKNVFTGLLLILVLVALPLSIVLVKQRQETRKKAAACPATSYIAFTNAAGQSITSANNNDTVKAHIYLNGNIHAADIVLGYNTTKLQVTDAGGGAVSPSGTADVNRILFIIKKAPGASTSVSGEVAMVTFKVITSQATTADVMYGDKTTIAFNGSAGGATCGTKATLALNGAPTVTPGGPTLTPTPTPPTRAAVTYPLDPAGGALTLDSQRRTPEIKVKFNSGTVSTNNFKVYYRFDGGKFSLPEGLANDDPDVRSDATDLPAMGTNAYISWRGVGTTAKLWDKQIGHFRLELRTGEAVPESTDIRFDKANTTFGVTGVPPVTYPPGDKYTFTFGAGPTPTPTPTTVAGQASFSLVPGSSQVGSPFSLHVNLNPGGISTNNFSIAYKFDGAKLSCSTNAISGVQTTCSASGGTASYIVFSKAGGTAISSAANIGTATFTFKGSYKAANITYDRNANYVYVLDAAGQRVNVSVSDYCYFTTGGSCGALPTPTPTTGGPTATPTVPAGPTVSGTVTINNPAGRKLCRSYVAAEKPSGEPGGGLSDFAPEVPNNITSTSITYNYAFSPSGVSDNTYDFHAVVWFALGSLCQTSEWNGVWTPFQRRTVLPEGISGLNFVLNVPNSTVPNNAISAPATTTIATVPVSFSASPPPSPSSQGHVVRVLSKAANLTALPAADWGPEHCNGNNTPPTAASASQGKWLYCGTNLNNVNWTFTSEGNKKIFAIFRNDVNDTAVGYWGGNLNGWSGPVFANVSYSGACPKATFPDADGDNKACMSDFTIWKTEYLANPQPTSPRADFNCQLDGDKRVSLSADFPIWKNYYVNHLSACLQ